MHDNTHTHTHTTKNCIMLKQTLQWRSGETTCIDNKHR